MSVSKLKQVPISLTEEAREKITFDEFKAIFGKHFIGKAETVEQGYTRITGRYARVGTVSKEAGETRLRRGRSNSRKE